MENGPNIYMRCREALLSGIPSEQSYALNHLVKISYERGDRYRFEQFPKLLEGLVEKALQVGSLFFDVNWTIVYAEPDDAASGPIGELNGFTGTADILDRIAQLKPRFVIDGVVSAEFSDQLSTITEALLAIRNMATHPDNATYASGYPMVQDLLCILLHLPKLELTVEVKHLALDIAEAITPHLVLGPGDPLYQTLLAQLEKHTDDRGIVLTALCAVGRISMDLAETNKLEGVPLEVLQKVKDWLLLNDDELMGACLDFLYQYTAIVPNMETLIDAISLEDLVTHLVRLLSHGAKREQREIIKQPEQRLGRNVGVIPEIPPDLAQRLLAIEEPERCYKWVRCFFEEDPEGQVTQIDIWQAYNKAFQEALRSTGRPMMQAAEFIRSITHVYQNAVAKIKREQGPNGAWVDKYAIDGIRPRKFPISPEGIEYFPCLWAKDAQAPKCLIFLASPEKLWEHILTDHLGAERDPETKQFKNEVGEYACTWAQCTKYPTPTMLSLCPVFAAHVKLHMVQAYGNYHNQPKKPSRQVIPAKTITVSTEETAIAKDPSNPNASPSAGGIPFSATLVLRNIARNVVKTEAQETLVKNGETDGLNERLFRVLRPRLYEVMAENKLLAPHVASLLQVIDEAK
jgi:chromatin structure-remodeling complex subunit RSC9